MSLDNILNSLENIRCSLTSEALRNRALTAMNSHLESENERLKADNVRLGEELYKDRKYFEGPSPLLGIFSQLERIEGLEQENERLRNRVAKLQSLGVVDIDAFEQDIRQLDEFKFHERLTPRKEMFKNIDRLNAQVEELTRERDVLKNVNERFIDKLREQINELTKHNHELAERAKRAEASCRLPTSVYKDAKSLLDWVGAMQSVPFCPPPEFLNTLAAVGRVAKHIYEGRS